MSFIESPRFPDRLGYGALGGPQFLTDIVILESGHESRNPTWSIERRRYDLVHAAKTATQLAEMRAFFLAIAKGRAYGFRFRDWADYLANTADGLLGAGVGTGLPTYQLVKRYTSGATYHDRVINKPVPNSVTAYRNAGALTYGSLAGQIALDTTTGLVTFEPDATQNAVSITVGASTQVQFASSPGGLIAGKRLYLADFTGADAGLVNGRAHTILGISGSGPLTLTLDTNTAGKTITLGSGKGKKYPQADDMLTWAGQFDVPVRFDSDEFMVRIVDKGPAYQFESIPLIEVRV